MLGPRGSPARNESSPPPPPHVRLVRQVDARQAESMISNDKNLMPSMVVKQQRGGLTRSQVHHEQLQAEQQLETERQVPAGNLDELLHRTRIAASDLRAGDKHQFDQNGLVLPRRVPHHHQTGDGGQQPATMRDLNRELKFNQMRGLQVLDQKSELRRAMEKLEESRRKKEAERERLTRRTSLELRLEERAQRLAAREQASGAGQSGGDSQPTNSGITS